MFKAIQTETLKQGRAAAFQRQFKLMGVFVAASVALTACTSTPSGDGLGTVGFVEGFLGGVAADEPRAALIGRDMLSSGGSAADAAVAMALTLSVTLPSSAGIGGGGVCMVHQRDTGDVTVLDFRSTPVAGGVAVPGLPRGLYALHARHGLLRWQEVVAPAENLARFGEPVSRALAKNLDRVGKGLARDQETQSMFLKMHGLRVLSEGDHLKQLDLASVLGRMRSQGPGDFYQGQLAQQIADGSPLSRENLRNYRPKWLAAAAHEMAGNRSMMMVPTSISSGQASARQWAAQRSIIKTDSTVVHGQGSTSFVAMDRDGGAVACSLTMNAPFGSGTMVRGTGILLAAGVDGSEALAPVMVVNKVVREVYAAVAGVAVNSIGVATRTMVDGDPLSTAITAVPGAATAMVCPGGMPPKPETCSVSADPRGFGLALGAQAGK